MVPMGPIDNGPRTGDKPWSEPMVAQFASYKNVDSHHKVHWKRKAFPWYDDIM